MKAPHMFRPAFVKPIRNLRITSIAIVRERGSNRTQHAIYFRANHKNNPTHGLTIDQEACYNNRRSANFVRNIAS